MRFPPRIELPMKPFRALKQLLISIWDGDAHRCLPHIDPEALDTVTVYWDRLMHSAGSAHCVSSWLTEMPCAHMLKHVTFILDRALYYRFDPECPPPAETRILMGYVASAQFLKPCLNMSQLQTLEISIDLIFQVDNAFVLELAQNLPHLESLSLVPPLKSDFSFGWSDAADVRYGGSPADPPALPTLDGLLPLFEYCIELASLKIAVESTFSISCSEASIVPSPRLRTLELWTTELAPVVGDDSFVDYFAKTFPCLDEFCIALPSKPFIFVKPRLPIPLPQVRARWQSVLDGVSSAILSDRGIPCSTELVAFLPRTTRNASTSFRT